MRYTFALLFSLLLLRPVYSQVQVKNETTVSDKDFMQEYDESYPVGKTPEENNVRKIAVDQNSTIWIATARGVLMKKDGETTWTPVSFSDEDKGPAYAVAVDDQSAVWMGTWNAVFSYQQGALKKVPGTSGPISLICPSREGIYAIGPDGVWLLSGGRFVKKNYSIARSVRSAVSDGEQGIWVASDVGLYHCNAKGTRYFQKTDVLLSAYLKGLSFDSQGRLWVAGLGGVTILKDGKKQKLIRPQEGCPSIYTYCVRRSPGGVMWVGTQVGVVRFSPDGAHSLRFSRRWLLDDQVNDIAFDREGNAWIATAGGVSAIKKRKMNLLSKQDYFYDVLMRRHIRKPWIAGQCHLEIPGDTSSWRPEDDDNDGEYGGNYLAMECFRYAVTKSEDARQKAGKAFAFLKQLREVTGGDGYFARTIVPADWKYPVHDDNKHYSDREKAEELVKEPRNKPVETRWRKSADGQWLWKGDASSDEWCGHMMGYYFYYELVADEAEKIVVRKHVATLVDHLMAHDFNMMDVDGTHTRWSVWSPASLNHDPEWEPDRSENSMELLAFLKLAYYMTGDEKYQEQYLRFIKKEHYLDNMAKLTQQNPAWFIYYDVMMQSYLYPILIKCEKDPVLKAWYEQHMDNWMKLRRNDRNPQINFFYCYSRNKKQELNASVDFLRDTPLDLINWNIDHTKREDVRMVHVPVLDDLQVNELPPASIRTTVRWDKNPWAAVNGVPDIEREPVFWLLPYWMGRYLKMIQ
ncbi:MAG: regulator [Bacteroidota bacterium]|nr:regulator [Bacteroidota bacterium]MDP4250283.1 regulator [Bacteroidota bacterium]